MAEPRTLAAGAPRYRQLAHALIRDIESGRHPVGALLPPELQLSEQYGVSRHTVREAIRQLAAMGMISRRQGVGTRVTAKTATQRYTASLSTLSDLFQYTKRTRLELLAERWIAADHGQASMLRCKPGQRWLMFETRRFRLGEDVPISYTEIYVLPAYEGIRKHLANRSVWVYGLIEKYYGDRILEVDQEIGAISVPRRTAKLLSAKPGSPGLQVLRYYVGAGERLLSMSLNIYPAERFKFSTRWRLGLEGSALGSVTGT